MSTAAEKKARLLAKAQKSQKPIDQSDYQNQHAITAHQQQQQHFAQQQQQQQQQPQLRPSVAASAAAAAASTRPAAAAGGYGAYTDDMDDMDQTLYIDQDASNALKLKSKTQLGPAGAQPATAMALRQQQQNAKQAQRAAASPQPRSQRPQQGSGPWEDDVEQFQQELSTPTPPPSRRIGPAIGIGGVTPGAEGVGISPTAQQRHVEPVPVLDSAAEERRLDALRAKKERAQARAKAGHGHAHGDAQQYEDSFSESREYSVSASQQASPAPSSAAAAAAAAAAATGWVDPNTRLQQVRVRAAPTRSNRHRGGGDPGLHEEDEQDRSEDRSEGAAAGEATQQAAEQEQDELDAANDQAYQRALQQRLQDASAAAAASASSASAATDVDPNDKQLQAYQQQLMLQAELAAQTQMRAERGELSQEELRAATMRQKRPPLILDWESINPQSFFNSTVPRGGWVQCRLIKRGGGFASFLHPRYELYTEEHQGGLFLATARKSSKTKPNYHLTTERFVKDEAAGAGAKGANGKQSKASAQSEDRPILKTSAGYAGKVAATLSRSDYIVYDSGYNASKSPPEPSYTHEPREEIGNISYKPHLSGKTPRKLAVLLPILLPNSHRDAYISREFKNEFLSSSLAYQHLWRNLQEAQQRARVPRAWMCLLNKPPRYHADTGQYVLDFCGRAPQVSVKNFQLVYPEEPDEVLFQLGRLDDENFSVDFRFPLAPIQAFAIALSSLDYKWTVD